MCPLRQHRKRIQGQAKSVYLVLFRPLIAIQRDMVGKCIKCGLRYHKLIAVTIKNTRMQDRRMERE